MNKVDINEWKEFKISKLFTIKPPAARSIKTYNEGEIPYVSSGSVNNGIVSYLEPKEDEELEDDDGEDITFDDLLKKAEEEEANNSDVIEEKQLSKKKKANKKKRR